MSINDLDLILKKDPIISTWPARSLSETPEAVEKDYLMHARTHLSLGDTAKYVNTAFKWVSGANKGAFIGAVLGEYGEGKTSFLVHLWAQSREQQICTVPPFEWSAFEQIVDAVAGWLQYVLQNTRPALARRIQRVHEAFQQQTMEQIARTNAQKTGRDYESVLETLQSLVDGGTVQLTEMSAARLLDFVAEATEIVQEAGFKGLLILLDEPEVAAKKLGNETVQHFIFGLANELHLRQGEYGVFLSMPANFFASAQSRFAALPARLEVRKCFPRLGDIYGVDFAEVLWKRYVEEFKLGKVGRELVTPLALKAIGQVGSSERKDLSYGPRSVVSAFRRMVDHYRDTSTSYEPRHLVQDVLDQEILVRPEYRSEILSVQRSPDFNEDTGDALMLLAAFPSGLRTSTLRELEIEDVLRSLSRGGGLVSRTAFAMGLRALKRETGSGREASPLQEMIEEIDGEYAPDLRAFRSALGAFCREVIPLVFTPRKGQQLEGWQDLDRLRRVAPSVRMGAKTGAFRQSALHFPGRAVLILASSPGASLDDIRVPELDNGSGRQDYDLIFHFNLRWSSSQDVPAQSVEISEDPDGIRPPVIRIYFDLFHDTIRQEHLAELVGADRMTLLWVLNLLERMKDVGNLPKDAEAEWKALRDLILRQLPGLLMSESFSKDIAQAAADRLEERLAGSGIALIGSVANVLLSRRYPEYATLIRQPHWKTKVDDYITALNSNEVPLSCKRGREIWKADADIAARVLGTSRMNLTGGAFTGFEHLVEVESKGRNAPIEVSFHIHPMEQEIRDLVTVQPTGAKRKLKRQGKERWYMPVRDLLPVLIDKGYTIEELRKIVDIGKARGSFDVTQRRGEDVVYCVPLDPDELKAQLRAKLVDLVAEIQDYKQLPDYVTRFDPHVMEQSIEQVQDDADYDRLMTRMNKEFVQNHSRLPSYFDRLEEKFTRVQNQVKGVRGQLSSSREVSQLKLPRATSPWGAALARYIVPNLQQTVQTLVKDSEQLLNATDQNTMRFSHSRQRTAQENLVLLKEGWSTVNDMEIRGSELCESTRELMQQLSDFSKWINLLSQSDQVYERLLDLKKEPAHQNKAQQLVDTFDGVSQDIAEHIEIRNVSGLPQYRQFEQQFIDIEKGRQQYLTGLKGSFDQLKDRLNQFLAGLKIDGRVQVVFNPLEIANCYDRLYEDGARLVDQRALQVVLAEMEVQERELRYARDVLRAIEPEQAASLLAKIDAESQVIKSIQLEVGERWLQDLMKDNDNEQMKQIADEIAHAFDTVREARQKVRDITVPQEPTSGRAQDMLGMLPEQQAIDLKEIVLQMIVEGTDPSQVLNTSLEGLADLFRRNCIQITVGRRRR